MFTLSVITINRNNVLGLQQTMTSVLRQVNKLASTHLQYIVVDGASTDGSQEIIKTLLQQKKELTALWVSEPDTGIYNAMNKGLSLATGDYCLFLNSGDLLVTDDALWQVERYMEANKFAADIYYADAVFSNSQGNVQRVYPDRLSLDFFYYDSLCHQAIFYKRELLLSVGGYDEQYRLIADWVMNIQLFRKGFTFCHMPILTTIYDTKGMTSGTDGYEKCRKERKQYYQLHSLKLIHIYMWIKRKYNQLKCSIQV